MRRRILENTEIYVGLYFVKEPCRNIQNVGFIQANGHPARRVYTGKWTSSTSGLCRQMDIQNVGFIQANGHPTRRVNTGKWTSSTSGLYRQMHIQHDGFIQANGHPARRVYTGKWTYIKCEDKTSPILIK